MINRSGLAIGQEVYFFDPSSATKEVREGRIVAYDAYRVSVCDPNEGRIIFIGSSDNLYLDKVGASNAINRIEGWVRG